MAIASLHEILHQNVSALVESLLSSILHTAMILDQWIQNYIGDVLSNFAGYVQGTEHLQVETLLSVIVCGVVAFVAIYVNRRALGMDFSRKNPTT